MNHNHEERSPAAEESRNRASGKDFGAGLVILLIALYALIESIRMPYYEEGERGLLSSPGLTPGLLSLGLIIMSLVLMVRARGFRLSLNVARPSIPAWRVLTVFAILVLYVAAIKPLGYVIATFLMLAIFQTVFARRLDLKYILIFCLGLSAVVTGALYYAFAKIFLIPMP